MFRKFVAFLGIFSLWGLVTPPSFAVFLDVSGHSYEESIEFLADQGLIQGYEDGTFRPDTTINRAELLKLVLGAKDYFFELSLTDLDCFPDVQNQWFAPYVCSAKMEGIVGGYPDGFYRPAQPVTVIEVAKILTEAFDFELLEEDEGAWYKPYLNFFHVNLFLSKYAVFPDAEASRGEVAYWIHQVFLIESGEEIVFTERANYSEGCSLPQPSVTPISFDVNGVNRPTIVSIPEDYDPNEPLALLIAFHGRTSPNNEVQRYYGFEKAAEGEAILVYPSGIEGPGGFTWANSGDAPGELRDYAYFDEIVEEITNSYCIDEDRIYAAGHSLGAWFANSLACARGDVLRGVATLGGARSESECTGPVAVMQWHNPNDEHASFSSALTARDSFLEQNACSTESIPAHPSWANCVEYLGCYEDAPVLWCPHTNNYSDFSGEYYPHTWPRATGDEMWDFFESL